MTTLELMKTICIYVVIATAIMTIFTDLALVEAMRKDKERRKRQRRNRRN